ncbi:MAG: hypothetical protein JKX81_08680 [Arenicella sp.]|nr:hypothetical protein [Arenicella sp.]
MSKTKKSKHNNRRIEYDPESQGINKLFGELKTRFGNRPSTKTITLSLLELVKVDKANIELQKQLDTAIEENDTLKDLIEIKIESERLHAKFTEGLKEIKL